MEKTEKSIEAAGGDSQAAPSITVNVKFRGEKIPISLSPESTVGDLKSRLQPLTYTPPLAQKLIYRGRILADSSNLKSLEITSGSKIMMTPSPSQLQVDIPDEVWNCASYVRILDITNNHIQELPEKIGTLKSLNKLFMNANDLCDEKINWDGLTQLKSLRILSFNINRLATLPPSVGSLTSLTQLRIAKNKLTCLPDELGCLNQLRLLIANCNSISSVPATIGNCSSLAEIDFSCNYLTKLPETIANLRSLKVLRLDSNGGLNSLPSNLFEMCRELILLEVDFTGITVSHLHQMDGYEEFDVRRRRKLQKLHGLSSRRPISSNHRLHKSSNRRLCTIICVLLRPSLWSS